MTNQAVEILREGMRTGRWKDTLPGRERLAEELGVSHQTIEQAMRLLAKEGWLKSQGPGRRRRIILPEGNAVPKDFRVMYLSYESMNPGLPQALDLLEQLRKAGFAVEVAPKSLLDLDMDVKRVARLVQQNPADAWIICSGSREVLEWFSQQATPAYAYFGNKVDIPIAGCSIRRNMPMLIQRLAKLGHSRIVLLCREENLAPKLSAFANLYVESLKAAGITPSSYHMPVWGYKPEGLQRCLDSLYQLTPPTALITSETAIMIAMRDHLARRGILSPRDVSLISLDQSPFFTWSNPQVAHFYWDPRPLHRRVVRWAKQVALGKDDRRQINTSAKFFEGGTIGPAPKSSTLP
ncbi:MAG TPA: substrate-binding domain-containing protein [Luteolibacter sp.]|nr:substrate-binding domain-containing protein [Luteolibacter sp.]